VLDRIQMQNFKAFRDLELRLAPLTLLSGLNGVGKSTVLQALGLLRQSSDAGSLTDEGLLLNGELVTLGVGQDVLFEDYEADLDQVRISFGLSTREGISRNWSVDYARDADLLRFPVDQRFLAAGPQEPEALFGKGFQYLRADRIVPAVSYPKSYDAAVRRGFLGPTGEHAVNFLRHHRDDPVINPACAHPGSRSGLLIDQVEAWMDEFCPGVNLGVEDLEGTDSVRLSYGFFGTAGIDASNRYRPTNVGFGLTYVLPVIVAVLATAPGGLLLLENPEAHLHPRGQARMGELLALAAGSGVQILVESHSDHVLNGIRLAVKSGQLAPSDTAVHYFQRSRRGESSVAHPRISSEGKLSEWPEGFFDEWDRALDALLD
jgi:predicted ATPase